MAEYRVAHFAISLTPYIYTEDTSFGLKLDQNRSEKRDGRLFVTRGRSAGLAECMISTADVGRTIQFALDNAILDHVFLLVKGEYCTNIQHSAALTLQSAIRWYYQAVNNI